MSPALVLACVAAYFAALLGIAHLTLRRGASEAGYLLGRRDSPWWLIAFGLVGDSLSGVTYLSVPGEVGAKGYAYFQVVLGYAAGYAVIAHVLLPLYYRRNLTSIYGYLGERFGPVTEVAGSLLFTLSRTLGAAARLFLAVNVLQAFVFESMGVPYAATAAAILGLMLVYTWRGGIQTLVWTDLFQSTLLLLGVGLSLVAIARGLGWGVADLWREVSDGPGSQAFFWDWRQPDYFWKQFLGGATIAIAMTGLDQNMMQKNLSCRSLPEAQRNIHAFIPVMLATNLLFLALGALLFAYARTRGIGIPVRTDLLFPTLALNHLGTFAAVVFTFGLAAATFSSADSVLTTLTTAFTVDVLRLQDRAGWDERRRTRVRRRVHLGFAVLLLVVILLFRAFSGESVISTVLRIAGYTYGPLLGLFVWGLCTRERPRDRLVPIACVAAPVACWVLERNSEAWFGGYRIGTELLVVNAAITMAGLLAVRRWRG